MLIVSILLFLGGVAAFITAYRAMDKEPIPSFIASLFGIGFVILSIFTFLDWAGVYLC